MDILSPAGVSLVPAWAKDGVLLVGLPPIDPAKDELRPRRLVTLGWPPDANPIPAGESVTRLALAPTPPVPELPGGSLLCS